MRPTERRGILHRRNSAWQRCPSESSRLAIGSSFVSFLDRAQISDSLPIEASSLATSVSTAYTRHLFMKSCFVCFCWLVHWPAVFGLLLNTAWAAQVDLPKKLPATSDGAASSSNGSIAIMPRLIEQFAADF